MPVDSLRLGGTQHAELRRDSRRRPRARGLGIVRRNDYPHSRPGPDGGAGGAADRVLHAGADMLASEGGSADRTPPLAHGRDAGVRSQGDAGPASNRNHFGRAIETSRLPDSVHRQVAPRRTGALSAGTARLRRVLRRVVQQQHGVAAPRSMAAARIVRRPEGDRVPSGRCVAHPKVHAPSDAVHREKRRKTVLPLSGLHDAPHSASSISGILGALGTRTVRRRGGRNRRQRGTAARETRVPRLGGTDLRLLHERQRPLDWRCVNARRIDRRAARVQGHDLGRGPAYSANRLGPWATPGRRSPQRCRDAAGPLSNNQRVGRSGSLHGSRVRRERYPATVRGQRSRSDEGLVFQQPQQGSCCAFGRVEGASARTRTRTRGASTQATRLGSAPAIPSRPGSTGTN